MPVLITCKLCKAPKSYPPSHAKRAGIYCSVKCRQIDSSIKRTSQRPIANCLICGREFYTTQYKITKGYGKFCTKSCADENRRINPIAPFRGRRHTAESKQKLRLAHRGDTAPRGENHYRWKAEGLGYSAIHLRIQNLYGNPRQCEQCSRTDAKRYEWANISGKYLISRNDWKRLCKSCHNIFDRNNPKRPELIFGASV